MHSRRLLSLSSCAASPSIHSAHPHNRPTPLTHARHPSHTAHYHRHDYKLPPSTHSHRLTAPHPSKPHHLNPYTVCRSGRARLQRQEPCRGRPRSTRDIWERAFNGRWPEKAARLFTREDHYHDWTFLYLSFHSQFHDDHFVLAMPEEHLLRQPAEAVFENPRVLARFEAAAEEWIFLIEEALEEIAARYVVTPTVVVGSCWLGM